MEDAATRIATRRSMMTGATETRESAFTQTVAESPHKWVYLFTEGSAEMRGLLGGKGAGVAEMTRAGLPVPPGFTITTEACNEYYHANKSFPEGMWPQALAALHVIEARMDRP